MKNVFSTTGKLEIVKRLTNSVNGNPRYRVSIGGVACVTKVDSMLGYTVENFKGEWVNATIGLHYNSATLNTVNLTEVSL